MFTKIFYTLFKFREILQQDSKIWYSKTLSCVALFHPLIQGFETTQYIPFIDLSHVHTVYIFTSSRPTKMLGGGGE